MVIHQRNNVVPCRNFSENQDIHDVVKLMLVRMLRRRYPNSNKVAIYSEFLPDCQNELYPDVYVDLGKKGKVVYEIQDKWSEDWEIKKSKEYDGVATLIVIKLKDMPQELNSIKKRLKEYLI